MTNDIDFSSIDLTFVTIQPYPLPAGGGYPRAPVGRDEVTILPYPLPGGGYPRAPVARGDFYDTPPSCVSAPVSRPPGCASCGGPIAGDDPLASVRLREGEPYNAMLGQRLIDESDGELVWSQDGSGDWWIVNRDDRDEVEHTQRCRRGYDGPGVKALDEFLRGYDVREGDARELNELASPMCGESPRARFPLRPEHDRWSRDLADRISERSGGRLSTVEDRHGNRYLIDSRDRDAFERENGRPQNCDCVQVNDTTNRLQDLLVRARDMVWINRLVRRR